MSFNGNCEQYWNEAAWVPISVLVNEWCQRDSICKSAKEYAILNACEKGAISYRRSDGKTFEDPVEDLHGRGILLIDRASFMLWVGQFNDPKAPQDKISPREKNNLHAIIGGLLSMLVSDQRSRRNQSGIITQLIDSASNSEPFTKSNLEKVFAEANRVIKEKGINQLEVNQPTARGGNPYLAE
ncbi:hypothetical protein [Serratia liquefaciens]|uniref:hypothetical protein n=1 Tax=Serratia liquefaciens TaxID=614 RepID=UPI0039057B52